MHGLIMLLLFATPLFAGFSNALVPLQIGAPDVAFPRLNMFAYWLYVLGGLTAALGFLTPLGAASFGWFLYVPLSNATYSPGLGSDLGIFGLAMGGFSTIFGSVNFITTIICMRAPGMTMFRMPVFTWTVLVTSLLALIIFPVLAVALLGLGGDRRFGMHIFEAAAGGAMLWQHPVSYTHLDVYKRQEEARGRDQRSQEMTATIDRPTRVKHPRNAPGTTFFKWITTTDHKVIGNLYFITSFVFFLLAGAMALIIRAELYAPGLQVVDNPERCV